MRRLVILIVLMSFLLACGPVEEVPELEPAANFTELPGDNETVDDTNESMDETLDEINDTEEADNDTEPVREKGFTKLPPDMKEFTMRTSDSILLYGTLYERDINKTIILLHMLGRDRGTWERFANELQNEYKVLAIDSRGHGRSQLSWSDFDENDFNKMVLDVKGAKEHLNTTNFVVIGASIGANTAVNFAVEDEDVNGIVLLSPGLDYKGVKTEKTISKVNAPMLIASAEGDSYAADSSQTLAQLSDAKLIVYNGTEHGTNMLGKGYGLEKEIFDFLDNAFAE